MHDLIVRNATIVDGTNSPAFQGSVVIDGRTITDVVHGDVGPQHARRVISADGHLLTPGFVDIHTHYDGQVCWDKQLTPSSWHGVTTVVMGNCGVGFAPVRPGTQSELVELMESVEDIPGTALHQGITWDWETFAEYLDCIDTPYSLDVGTQVPHVAVRHYVMGSRCYENATTADILQMQQITRDALACGALGFSTSRYYSHLDKDGNLVPGTRAPGDEILMIAQACAEVGHGTIEIISDQLNEPEELAWIEQVARTTGRTVTTLQPVGRDEKLWRLARSLEAEGLKLRPQVGARPPTILMTLEATVNPMLQYPAYRDIQHLPLAQRQARLTDPTFRQQVRSEAPSLALDANAQNMLADYDRLYVLDSQLNYEPDAEDSVTSIARRQGIAPIEVIMDTLSAGIPLIMLFGEYPENLEPQRLNIADPLSVFGLSDAGAHCGFLMDASVPTYMLAYFTRDRRRGPKLPLEWVVHKMSKDTAGVYGLRDRGTIAPGFKADLNLIDYERLALAPPEMVHDLPAGGKRLVQRAHGYLATVCSGEVTYEQGEQTGVMPGRLVRGNKTPA